VNPTFLYVAAFYVLAVWLGRRGGIDLPWRIAAFFYVLVLIFFWKPMTQDYLNVPVDFVLRLPPWAYVFPRHYSANGEMNDLALQIVPWAHQVREAWRSLNVPLWNAAAGCGYPLLGNGQSSALSLFRLLALPLDLAHSLTAEAAWKLLAALSFMYLFCRRRGYSDIASAIGAVSFAFSTFIIVWLHFPLVTVACFLPAVFYSIDLLLEKVTRLRVVFFIGLWAVMLTGGHPETASHAAFAGATYILFVIVTERRRDPWRLLAMFAGTGIVALLISLPFIVPFAEGLTKSRRYQALQVHPSAVAMADLRTTALLFQPHFYGAVPEEKNWGMAIAEFTTGFAGVLGIAAFVALLLRLIVQRRWRERESWFVLATPFALGIALGWPVVSGLFHKIPGFALAANGRLRLMLCFLLAVQAAAVVELVQRKAIGRYLLAGLGVVTVLMVCLVTRTEFPSGDWARDNAMGALLPSILVVIFASMFAISQRTSRWLSMMVAFAVIVELWTIGIGWNPPIPKQWAYPPTPMVKKLIEVTHPPGDRPPPRMVGLGPNFFPNVAAMYGMEDIRTHDPMANGRYMGFLRVLGGYKTQNYFALWEDMNNPLLDYLSVKYVAVMPSDEVTVIDAARYREIYNGRDGRVYENGNALPRFFAVRNVVLEFVQDKYVHGLAHHTDWANTAILHQLKVSGDRERLDLLAPRPLGSREATVDVKALTDREFAVHVNAPRYTLVVSSEPWWPGWRIKSKSGAKIRPIQVNGPFLGFVVPPGVHDLRVIYSPVSFWAAVWVSLATIAGVVGWVVWGRRRVNAQVADPRTP
jgi:hypothetical protein